MQQELDVLVEQLDELLGEPAVDVDDALEIATVAGLAARLGANPSQLADAEAWRTGMGEDLIDEMWNQVDLDPLLEAVDGCTGGSTDEIEIEEAIYDVDDVIAAAVWCGRIEVVRGAAHELARIVRTVPDVFVPIAPMAARMAALPTVAEHIGLFDYWLALADCRET